MQCDQCKEREAVVHLTQIVEEQVTTQHLCEKCAAERGVESSTLLPKTPLGSFLAAMGKSPSPRGTRDARGLPRVRRHAAGFPGGGSAGLRGVLRHLRRGAA